MRRAVLLSLAISLAGASLAAPALAQTPPPYYAPPAEPKTRWYGWQILIPGITSEVLTTVGVSLLTVNNSFPFVFAGLAGDIFSGPIVHWAHGHVGRGFASFGLNLGAATLASGLWYVGLVASIDHSITPYIVMSGVGVSVMTTGMLLDAMLLAREPIRPADAARRPFNISVAPLIVPGEPVHPSMKRATVTGVSLVGTF